MDEQKVPVLTLNTQSGAQQALEQAVAQLEAPKPPMPITPLPPRWTIISALRSAPRSSALLAPSM